MDALAYRTQLQALLPPGPAWPRDEDATLTRLLHAAADEFARVDGRTADLLEEADPLTALELLPDWERVAGLPDACNPADGTVRERQLAVTRKLTGLGGQSRAYFIDLASRLGLEVEIVEFAPFDATCRVDAELCEDAWRFAFEIRALPASESSGAIALVRFADLTTESRVDERLRSFGVDSLECVVSRASPAQSIVLFAYPEDPEPVFQFDFLAS